METFFLSNLLLFARLLRELGFVIPPDRIGDLARVLDRIGVTRREDVYHATRALFVHRQTDLPLFDRAFRLFFSIQGNPQPSVIDPTQAPTARGWRPKTIEQLADEARQTEPRQANPPPTATEIVPLYSPVEILRHKRFDQLSDEELRQARRALQALEWRVSPRKTRRYKRIPRGARLDLSRLLRRNLKHGADLYELPARERKYEPRPLVVLADISGSMERYSRMVLQLVHALGYSALISRVEVFVFGTRLTRTTSELKRRSVDEALARIGARVPDWAGGTRIGDALKTFNYRWARRVLRQGAVVLIISDGWDRGDLDLLQTEMARLQRSCSRLIWLNPLLGDASFRAEVQGLRVALPFVDDHLPIHNLASLEQLVARLATIGPVRPLRRQRVQVSLKPALAHSPDQSQPIAELPQMGTSDYVRRTMVLRTVDGIPTFLYEENPSTP